MGEARNDYPRLCWGCLGIIDDASHDYANGTYGGVCHTCAYSAGGALPGLHEVLGGYLERMNDISERGELQKLVATLRESKQTIRDEAQMMNVAEASYVRAFQQLHAAALFASRTRTQLIGKYMIAHHPDVPFRVREDDGNLLALDIQFPGAGIDWSRALILEVVGYLQRLLDEAGLKDER